MVQVLHIMMEKELNLRKMKQSPLMQAVGEEGCNHTCKSTEQQDGKSEDKCDASRNSAPECEGKLSEQQKGDPSSHCKSQGERGSPTGSAPQGRSTQEQANGQLTAKPMKGEGVASGEEMNSSRS